MNSHVYSNSTSTFGVAFDGLSGTTPKAGDFIAKFGSGESITKYTPSTSKFGTVAWANSTYIIYALGSISYTATHSSAAVLNNFVNNDAVIIYDTSKDGTGGAKAANGYNATIRATGGTIAVSYTHLTLPTILLV